MANYTLADVITWMVSEFEKTGELYQQEAVSLIADRFGTEFTYDNPSGNSAIHRDVLAGFRKATEHTAVWEASQRYWRKRQEGDSPTRQQ